MLSERKEHMTEEELKELARKKKNEYQRKWRAKNKDKVKQYNKNYWKRKVLEQ